MAFFSKLIVAISQVHPLVYLLTYLTAIPAFGLLFAVIATHGFYAPYARYEPGGVSDTAQLASSIEAALHRSFDGTGREFVVGNWKLDPRSLRVDDVKSADGTHLSFRVRLSAEGIGEMSGARQLGWAIIVTIPDPERPMTAVFSGPDAVTTYRFPEVPAGVLWLDFHSSTS